MQNACGTSPTVKKDLLFIKLNRRVFGLTLNCAQLRETQYQQRLYKYVHIVCVCECVCVCMCGCVSLDCRWFKHNCILIHVKMYMYVYIKHLPTCHACLRITNEVCTAERDTLTVAQVHIWYICMYIYKNKYKPNKHVIGLPLNCTQLCKTDRRINICVCIYIYKYVCLSTNIYIYIYMYMYMRVYLHIYIFIYIYIHVYICVCIYILMCIFKYIFLCLHVYLYMYLEMYVYIYISMITFIYICLWQLNCA